MPPPLRVELVPHDPAWASAVAVESELLMSTLARIIVTVHHVGSTAIPGIMAKPILDLMPAVTSLGALDEHQKSIESLGYEWWGEFGLPGRRHCTKNDPITGRRLIQLHCYALGSSEIARHPAFRDYLRGRPELAQAYETEKVRCRALHPDNSHAYGACKSKWIEGIESEALLHRHPSVT